MKKNNFVAVLALSLILGTCATTNAAFVRGSFDVANVVENSLWQHWHGGQENKNVWADYIHTKIKNEELDSIVKDKDVQYNGIVIGKDITNGLGIALFYLSSNINVGQQTLGGLRADRYADAKHYGGSIYGDKQFGRFRVLSDITFLHGKYEDEFTAHSFVTGSSDAKTDTINAGVNLEYSVKIGQSILSPFVGLRYLYISNKKYEIEQKNSGMIINADLGQNKFNTWVVPIGITYQGNVKEFYGWNLKSYLSAGYLINYGDREKKINYNYANDLGLHYSYSLNYEMADKSSFFVRTGLAFGKENMMFGIGYNHLNSSHVNSNSWGVNFNISF